MNNMNILTYSRLDLCMCKNYTEGMKTYLQCCILALTFITHILFFKFSEEYQRLSWEALKKSLNGLINKVNVSNIKDICKELFQENLVRGR